jgi:4'-phosphopantetheinyl transferase EntD
MGVIVKDEINDCLLGIWEIKEDLNSLFSFVKLEDEELETLNSFGNENRKIEWLSVRALINDMTGKNSRIIYNNARKPFLKGNSFNISISHSHQLTSILISRTKRVGIDLEYMSHKITNLEKRFINEQEYITSDQEKKSYHLYIHWCAKEAMYKICDKQNIHFRDNLSIIPFEPRNEGIIKGRVLNIHGIEDFRIQYNSLNGYAIAWTAK